MTIKVSNNVARLIDCAITDYITHLTDMYVQETDPDKKDRLEECIFELDNVKDDIGGVLND